VSKIIKFPNRSIDLSEVENLAVERLDSTVAEACDRRILNGSLTFWKVVKILAMVVRMPIFFALYFLRAPVMMLCSMLYLPLFLLALFAWYAFPEKSQMWGGFGIISLLSFVLMYVYDLVLSWLSPHELVRTL
jgi:hypothetical protein